MALIGANAVGLEQCAPHRIVGPHHLAKRLWNRAGANFRPQRQQTLTQGIIPDDALKLGEDTVDNGRGRACRRKKY